MVGVNITRRIAPRFSVQSLCLKSLWSLRSLQEPATCRHGWSKHGFSRIPSKHPQIAKNKYVYNNHA